MDESTMATVGEVMKYFGFNSMAEFKGEWVRLSQDERDWFKREVYKITN